MKTEKSGYYGKKQKEKQQNKTTTVHRSRGMNFIWWGKE